MCNDRRVAQLERMFHGDKWQLFAAAYEGAVADGSLLAVDPGRATFRYRHTSRFGISLLSGWQDVEVAVSRFDDVSCVVFVETRAFTHGTVQRSDWGEGRRIATKFLNGLAQRWAEPRRSLAAAGWLADPEVRDARRFWDGAAWTPFVWYHDDAYLATPDDYAPPLRAPKSLLGAWRRSGRALRELAVVLVLVGVVAYLVRY
jgi:Protein of unknown function (DUF2510)